MHDKLSSIEMLLRSHENTLSILLAQRASYTGKGIPDKIEMQIDKEEKTIRELRSELRSLLESYEKISNSNNPTPIKSNDTNLVKGDMFLARMPNPQELLPILVPHNLVLNLQEYTQIQGVAFAVSSMFFGGSLGILVNWLTAEKWGVGQTAAAWVALTAFSIGCILTLIGGWWWGYRRSKLVNQGIDKYIAGMQIVRMPLEIMPLESKQTDNDNIQKS